jgi:hypothetical protein
METSLSVSGDRELTSASERIDPLRKPRLRISHFDPDPHGGTPDLCPMQ